MRSCKPIAGLPRNLAFLFAVLISSPTCGPAFTLIISPPTIFNAMARRSAPQTGGRAPGANTHSSFVPVRLSGHPSAQALQRQIFFERNDGQTDRQVLYLSHGFGYSLFLTRAGATIVLPSLTKKGTVAANRHAEYFRFSFAGANPQVEVTGIEELPGESNYFFGPDAKFWHTHIPQFAKVRYANLYPGIDLIFYSRDGQLEYDVVAAPGADIAAVHLKADGANAALSRNEEIVLRIGKREAFQFRKPHAYQPGNQATDVNARYSLRGDDLSFALSGYDRSRPLVIDPALIFSTYLASNCQQCADSVTDMTVDSTGVYLTGLTSASSFPATANGPAPVTLNENRTFVLKLDPSGSQIIYATFLSSSRGLSIAVDGAGSAYVSGSASVPSQSGIAPFPLTTGVFSGTVPSNPNPLDVPYAAKLSPDGSQILYSTLLQQPTADGTAVPNPQMITPAKIAVDSQGALYLTGEAVPLASLNITTPSIWMALPVTQGAFQTTPGNLFAMKLTPNASGLDYCTYIDGAGSLNGRSGGAGIAATGIAVDLSGDAFLTGTATAGFPTTPGVYQSLSLTTPGGTSAFVMELAPDGTSPLYSTFFGGSGANSTSSFGIAIDPQGEAVIVGYSFGPLVTSNAFCGVVPSGTAGYIAKLTAGGTGLVYSTSLCGDDAEADAVALDPTGAAYVTGITAIPVSFLPVVSRPIQAYIVPGAASHVALKLDTSGALQWATFLGGNVAGFGGTGSQSRVSVDESLAAYILNNSIGFPTTPNAVGLNNQGVSQSFGPDFLLKIAPGLGAPVPLATPTSVTFPGQKVSTTSTPVDIQVGNFGDALLSVAASTIGDFSETDDCSTGVPGGQKCDINVLFTPTATGVRTGTLTLNFGGSVPSQVVPLSGSGTAPAVSLSPTSLSFGEQATGTTSGGQQVTITNSGTAPLTISSIQVTSQFGATNTCGSPVAPGNGCTIQITFTPAASGPQTGTLSILDNASNSPQTVALAGNQPASFSISPAAGSSSTSASVTPGHTATYSLSVSGSNGFTGAVKFTCTGAPLNSTCAVAPNPANISGQSAVGVTVSVSTQSANTAAPSGIRWPNLHVPAQFPLLTAIMLALLISVAISRRSSAFWKIVPAGLAIVILAICAGCGGASSSTPPPGTPGTPTGQYTIVVTGTASSITQSMQLSLTVN
jgi:Abnormal spindle-like microcephaly-assoc'd, ASPM-SPD-2-Hydin